jgi:hypothetical protein
MIKLECGVFIPITRRVTERGAERSTSTEVYQWGYRSTTPGDCASKDELDPAVGITRRLMISAQKRRRCVQAQYRFQIT